MISWKKLFWWVFREQNGVMWCVMLRTQTTLPMFWVNDVHKSTNPYEWWLGGQQSFSKNQYHQLVYIVCISKTYSAVFCWRILSYLFGLVCAVHSSSAPLYHWNISVVWRIMCRPELVCTIHSHRYRCWYVLSDQERNWSLVLSLWDYAQICMKCMLKRDVYLKCSEVKYVCAAADHIALISSLLLFIIVCLCLIKVMMNEAGLIATQIWWKHHVQDTPESSIVDLSEAGWCDFVAFLGYGMEDESHEMLLITSNHTWLVSDLWSHEWCRNIQDCLMRASDTQHWTQDYSS